MAHVVGWGSLILAGTSITQLKATAFEHEANLMALDTLIAKGYLDNVGGILGGYWVSSLVGKTQAFPHASFKAELDVMVDHLRKKRKVWM